ncbi:MAG: DNA ligase D [Acidobacteria bacterium]|nr:DNA ligase D [Acidobacteriota bacterium]
MWRDDPATVRPMLASTGEAPLDAATLAYEPKYDGIRAIVSVLPHDGTVGVRLWSRLGNEKTAQFPELVAALQAWGRRLDRPVLLDGEIVALDAQGEPSGFQGLQGRIHLKAPRKGAPYDRRGRSDAGRAFTARQAVAFIAFDLLRLGDEDLRLLPLRERRSRLGALFADQDDDRLRLSEQIVGDGRPLYARAQAQGWEGLIAKRLDSTYRSGRRSPDWRKLKLVRRQACVIAGWTDPRGSRPFFGALLLGLYDGGGRLRYVGHTGAGFADAELGRIWKRLRALQVTDPPFDTRPRTNERPHWVHPQLVAEVKFTEWTADGRLRHPTYLGLREDVKPEEARQEPDALLERPMARALSGGPVISGGPKGPPEITHLLAQLDAIDDAGGDGVLELPGGARLEVSNLRKVFWPRLKLTKGDLFRHYVRAAPYLLPVLADRPLVMKRYPNGVAAKPFYQHRAPDTLPAGVRVERVATGADPSTSSGSPRAESRGGKRRHIVGGSLVTLLYTVQLASISQDPWFSRMGSDLCADDVAIDLDPPEGVRFSRVLDVARWVREELDALDAPAFAKTSGAGGLHVYVPMPPDTRFEAGLLFCQIVATMVARKHPKAATVERSLAARGRRIYVDYLQNVRGKTLASAYSARANDFAGVSTPLTWDEIDAGGLSPRDFTIRTFADRIEAVGDLWAPLRTSRGANLRAVMKYAEPQRR